MSMVHQASLTQNNWTKKSANFRGRKGIVWYTLLGKPTGPFLLAILLTFVIDTWVMPATSLQTEEESPLAYKTHISDLPEG